jgi:four helix bundle protein
MEKFMKTKLHALDLAIDLHKEVVSLKLKNPIRDQFERASLSIALNITEGTGRSTPKDRGHFFTMAMGSVRECQTLALLSSNENLIQGFDHLGGFVYGLQRSTRKK